MERPVVAAVYRSTSRIPFHEGSQPCHSNAGFLSWKLCNDRTEYFCRTTGQGRLVLGPTNHLGRVVHMGWVVNHPSLSGV